MDKYSSLTTDIFSIFSSVEWLAESIQTFPVGFTQTGGFEEFIRVNVVTDNTKDIKIVEGQVLIDIFIQSGKGPNRANFIADKLDKYLAGKMLMTTPLKGSTQTASSTLAHIGIDSANASLHRYRYTLPFNYFGV